MSALDPPGELAGRLTERVTLEQASDTPDGGGGVIRSWTALATVAADVQVRVRDEQVIGGRRVQRPELAVILRRRVLPPLLRLRWKGQVYALTSRLAPTDLPDRLLLTATQEDAP